MRIHLPKFIHHDHHKKVITIHHHHHKPKKEHHHKPHIPHLHKPHIPHGHHYHHHNKKTSTHSVGHSNHNSHGHHTHHGQHGHHGLHHGHHGHNSHKAHDTPIAYDPPTVNYAPPVTNYDPPSYDYTPPSYDHDFSYKSSVPNIVPDTPRVHGVVHTVKQVKVFDSLPNALPSVSNGNSYEVTEEGNQDDEEFFTAVNAHESFPATYGFIKNAAPEGDTFSDITQQNSVQLNHNPFENAIQPTSYTNLESFIYEQGASQGDSSQGVDALHDHEPSHEDFTNGIGGDIRTRELIPSSGGTPVLFSRQAGIQELTNTEGFQSGSYWNR